MNRTFTFWSILSFVSASIFIGSEISVVGASLVWAASGLLNLGLPITIMLAALVAVPCLLGIAIFTKLVFDFETNSENQ